MERTIVYFAWVREQIGIGEERILLPADVHTLADLAKSLAQRGGGYAAAFADMTKLRGALDMEMVPLNAVIGDAKEIAFFPPVTGG
jgi:molybdopterin synthase sulfur carrier subunit